MLNKLRNSSKNSFIKITLGSLLTILILSFAMWGTEDLVGITNKQNTVASVGKIDISSREFISLYSRQTEEIRKLLGQSLDIEKGRQFGYVDRALSSLINRALFNNQANELGLSVSDINVRDRIIKDDAFKDDLGQFSELIFRQLISESGYTEDTYIKGTRQDLAREQMVETIRSSLKLPKTITENLGKYNMEERSVNYLSIKPENQKYSKPSLTEIKKYFDENKLDFKTKEYRGVETLLLDAKKYAESIIVTEEEIELLYEERKDSLIKPERRYLKQILVDSMENAEIILNKLSSNLSFSEVALKYANLKEEDIDLGWNTRNELPEEIVTPVFKLSKNQVSKPIKSVFGWHIIKTIDIEKKEELSYEDVKSNFKQELLLEKGKEAVYDLQDDVEDFLASGDSLKEISEKLEVNLIKATSIDSNGFNTNGTKNSDYQDERILRTVFNQKENEEGNLIDIDKDEGLAISIVNNIIPSRQMTYEEARIQVEEKLIQKKKFESANIIAKKIKKEIEEKKGIEKVASRFNLELRGVSNFNRIQPDDSELPLQLISKIFDSKVDEVIIYPRDNIEVLLVQTASITNSYGKNEDDLESFKKKIQDDMSIDILAQFSEILRQKYKISINDDVINQLN
ncbi:SurA N-terminal domain-containing protein [Rickettsiales bacterium]|nr:SurA N-terminal domain-containing protein [Rickettsiales bacterium]